MLQEIRFCEKCCTIRDKDDNFCWFCGTAVTVVSFDNECQCGNKLMSSNFYCEKCGRKVTRSLSGGA